mgnify:CR=1 FL=1
MKKFKKLVSSILITMLTVATLGSISAVKAASAGPLYLGIVSLRRAGYGYQQEGSKVWKIAEYDSENGKTADLSKTIYCIKGGPGFGSSDMATGGVPTISKYTQKFNLKDLASIPSTYSRILPTGSNYNSLMWLLDNIYIMPAIGTDNTTAREEFLKSKIPNELYELITDDDIDAVQQLAIWYFTNPSGDKYHYETSNFKINSIANVDSNYASMGDIFGDDGWDREDAIEALFQYYITNAKANSNYKSTNNTTSPIEIVKSNATMTKVGSNYVAGPYKINQLLNVDYTLNATFTDINGTTITPSIGIKDVSENVTATTKTLKELVGQEFYLIMPTSSNISGIKMTVNTSYTSKTVDYWSVVDAPTTEQPVVIVNETPLNFSDTTSIVVPKPFDLSLRKFITNINGTEITNRIPQVDVSKLASGEATTATYNHQKTPLKVAIGDVVTYTIRVYNEGDIDGYVEEITDHLPDQLEFIAGNETNTKYGWTVDSNNSKIIKTKYLSKANETTEGDNKIKAFDGTKLDYKDVKVVCKVVSTDPMPTKITNIADITKFTDGNGNTVTDRDSQENNVNIPSDLPGYKDDEIGKDYVPGQQDDDDFEKLKIKEFDLALRKFITKVNNTEIKSRIPQVDTTPLKNGTGTTAIYNHSKEPVKVSLGAVVEYIIRVYNEGQVDGYVEEIKDHLPDQLEFIKDNETNKKYGWTVDSTDSKVIKTSYLSKANEKVAGENKIPAFDGTTLSYKEVKVACKVVSTDPMPSKITNLADISDFTDGEGNKVTDRDSKEDNVKIPEDRPGYKDDESKKDYVPGQEDDDDFEKVTLVKFDLSLRKFITAVNNTEITSRIPQVDVTPIKDGSSTTAKYDHPKDPVLVSNGNIVTYTIRVFNEGEMDGYASEIKDDMPQGLKFLTDNKTNIEYRWKMLDKDGKETENLDEAVSIVTDYLSKEQEKTAGANLLKAFDGEKLDYRDVKVAFEVTEPNTSDRILINQAQISKDSDKDGNDVTDQDSVPDKWNEGEDDQDIEKVKVQYFDLSLRKWVTQAIVTENGEEKIIESGHKAEDDPEDVVKVDLKKSKINKVTIKFRYKIRVKNEGNIAGYAKELKDYIPNGLKFVPEDNPLWKQIDEKTITTDQTKDILLQPGDTTEVEVVLTWINDSENFGVMDNWAEISKDQNDFNSPDIDSTPDNNKKGEDDIDDAPVSVGVQTGQIKTFTTIGLAVLVILSSGVVLIKKFVL